MKRIWEKIVWWFSCRSECCVCRRWISGNPFVCKNISHGYCRKHGKEAMEEADQYVAEEEASK